jgi:hypothetical protein
MMDQHTGAAAVANRSLAKTPHFSKTGMLQTISDASKFISLEVTAFITPICIFCEGAIAQMYLEGDVRVGRVGAPLEVAACSLRSRQSFYGIDITIHVSPTSNTRPRTVPRFYTGALRQ